MKVTGLNLKIISILCAFAVILSSVYLCLPFISAMAESNPSDNLVLDSGFDEELGTDKPWMNLWGSVITNATADYTNDSTKVGDRVLQIPNWQGGVMQQISVEEGFSYELTFDWAPCASGGSTTKMNVLIGDSFGDNKTGKEFIFDETISSQNFVFETFSITFTATKTGKVWLRFDRHDCGSNNVRIDDVVITKAKKVEQGAKVELVKDGKFDNAIGVNWTQRWGSSIVPATSDFADSKGKTGDNCLKIPNWQGGVIQTVKVEEGKSYKLEFLIAPGAANGATSKTNISLITASNKELIKDVFSSQNYVYEKVSYEFKCSATETATLMFDRNNCGTCTVYIDDVSIIETTPAGGDFFFGGDFEEPVEDSKDLDTFISDDNYGWLLLGNSVITEEKAALNNKSVLADKEIYGRFAVDSGETVGFYGKYFGETGAQAKITVSADREKEKILYEGTLNGNGDWQDISAQFETADTTIVYVHIESLSKENYFDNLKLLKLIKVSLNATSGAKAELDCEYTIPGATVTLNITEFLSGFSVADGYPVFTAGGADTPLTKVSDTQYTFVMPEVSATVTVRFTAPIGTELLPDVGFESGKIDTEVKHHWNTIAGQVNIVNTTSYDGDYSAEAVKYAYYSLCSDVYIEEGSTYLLSFMHSGANPNAGIFLYDGWQNNYIDPVLTGDDDDWNRYARVFTATKSGTMTVLVKNEKSPNPAYFDNVSLKKVDPNNPDPDAWQGNYNPDMDTIPDTSNILKDSSFESHKVNDDKTQGWTPWNSSVQNNISFTKSDWCVNSGDYAMRLAANTVAGATQIVKVKPFTSYEMTFYCLADTDGAGVLIGTSETDKQNVFTYTGVKASQEIQKYNVVFKTPGISEIYLTLSNNTGYAVFFDDVTLNELDDSVKGDLGYRKTAKLQTNQTDEQITIAWSSVKSKLCGNGDLTYNIYCSETAITTENIVNLTPVATRNGKDIRNYTVKGLKPYTNYYVAIEAVDKSGNKAYLISDVIKTNVAPATKIMNGGFETNSLLYWYTLTPNVAIYNTGASGKYSAEMRDWSYLLYQPVITEPDTEYVFSYDATQASGMVKFYILNNGSLMFGDALYSNQIEESFDYKNYSGTVKTGAETNRVTIGFTNGEHHNYAYIDNVYFKKIENKDLYFFNEPQSFFVAEEAIIINWMPVHSTDKPENIKYEVFISESEINAENIKNLTPFTTLEGAESTMAAADGLQMEKGYYFAVRATDSLGNIVEEYSSAPFYTVVNTKEDEKAEEEEEENLNSDFEDEEPLDDSVADDSEEETEDEEDDFDYNDDFEWDSDSSLIEIPDEEIDEDTVVKTPEPQKKRTQKNVTTTTVTPLWGRRIAGIILISAGSALAVFAVIWFIKKRKGKGV